MRALVIIPAFNEAAHLAEVITALAHSLEQAKIDHEIYVVNNGSSDGTSDVIRGLHAKNPRILGIELAQNQQYGGGILAGLAAARGEVLGWAHADGQTDPGDIIRLYQRMRAEDRELRQVELRQRRARRVLAPPEFFHEIGSNATRIEKLLQLDLGELLDFGFRVVHPALLANARADLLHDLFDVDGIGADIEIGHKQLSALSFSAPIAPAPQADS